MQECRWVGRNVSMKVVGKVCMYVGWLVEGGYVVG